MSDSNPLDSALGVALAVAAALEAVGADYFVGGSVASSLQGEPRATDDVDFVVDMTPPQVDAFVACLGSDFDVDVVCCATRCARRSARTSSISRW